MVNEIDVKKIDSIVMDKYEADSENLLHILQDINSEYSYIPEQGMKIVAERLCIPVSQVYSVATYYKALNLEPRGRHVISVCTGTACHVRGAGKIIEKIERELGIKAGGTSSDMKFSLQTVRCIGCCSLGPVINVGEDTHGRLKQDALPKILKKYE